MKKIGNILIIFSVCSMSVLAQLQEVISSSGGYFTNSQGSMAFTLGEYMISTYKSSNLILTQGFNQTFLPETPLSGNIILSSTGDDIIAYPNPVTEMVKVFVKNHRGLSLILCDINGTIIHHQNMVAEETSISFKELLPAVYILKFYRGSYEVMTFKITKQ